MIGMHCDMYPFIFDFQRNFAATNCIVSSYNPISGVTSSLVLVLKIVPACKYIYHKSTCDTCNIDFSFFCRDSDIRRFQSHPSGAFGTSDK